MSIARRFWSNGSIALWSLVACLSIPAQSHGQVSFDRGAATTRPLDEKAAARIVSSAAVEQPRPALELSPDAIDNILNGVDDDATMGMAGAAAYSRFQAIDRIDKAHAKWKKDATAKGLVFLTTLQPKNVVANYEVGNDSAAADAKANRLAAAAKMRDEQKQKVTYDFADEIHISYYYAPLVDSYFWGPESKRPAFGWKVVPIASLVCEGPVQIDYSLGGSFAAFRAGVAADLNNQGISFQVVLDGKEAWRCDGPIDPQNQKPCLLDVRGVRVLSLMVYQARSSPTNNSAQGSAWTNPVLFRHLPGNNGSGATLNSKPASPSDNQPAKSSAEVQAIEKRIEEVQSKLDDSTLRSDERARLAAEMMELRKSLRNAKGE